MVQFSSASDQHSPPPARSIITPPFTEHRWVFEDGLLALMGLVMAHLFKEAWWRETGEWLGEEVPHEARSKEQTGA